MKKLLLLAVAYLGLSHSVFGLNWASLPGSVTSGQPYTVSATHGQNNIYGMSLTILKNGAYVAGNGGSGSGYVVVTTTYAANDTGNQTVSYQANVSVSTQYGNQNDSIYGSVNIVVPNSAPTITWVQNPASAQVNQYFAIQARGNDGDGNLTNVFVWREWTPFAFNGGGNGYEGYSDANGYWQSTPGNVTFMAQAQDSSGATSPVIYHTVTITNNAPTISASAASIYVGQTATVSWNAADSDGNFSYVNSWVTQWGSPYWDDLGSGGATGTKSWSSSPHFNSSVPATSSYLFVERAVDGAGAYTDTYATFDIINRAPNNPTISGSGAGVTFGANGQYYMWLDNPITLTGTVHDDDGNLTDHAIYYQRVTGTMPDPGAWLVIDNDHTPSNGTNSTKVKSYTPNLPGRYDFHTNGHDGYLWGTGASITVNVYGPTNGATFVSQVVNGATNPSSVTVNPGQSIPVTVTMKNSGDKPWNSDATPHRLGAVNDVPTWGLTRVALPVALVNPQSNATFTFNVTAPNAPGNYTFQWGMVEDGVQWFGAYAPTVTITVNNTAPIISAMTATPSTLLFGQTTTVSATATDVGSNLAFHGLLVLFQDGSNWYRGTMTDHSTGWGNHPTTPSILSASYTSGVTSGGSSTRSIVHRPSWVGTQTYHSNAHDGSLWCAPAMSINATVNKATPLGTFANRTANATGSGYTVQAADLAATFANPYSGAVTAPTGSPTYSIVGPGTAVTAGTVLTGGQTYTIRATYPGDGNYTTATKDATFTIGLDPLGDADSDGMPNGWEQQYFGSATAGDPNADPDNDGFTNVAEYNLGKNPTVYDAGTSTLGNTATPGGWPNGGINPTIAVGATAGQLAVDKSGALTYTVPIWTTPGTAGMEPKVSLNYSSQAGNGVAGFGWSLSGVSAITRGGRTMAIDGVNQGMTFTANDRFYLDGQRLILISGTYGVAGSEYRTELDSFTKVIAYGTRGTGPAYFKAWTKAGLIIEFGNTSDSAFDAWGRTESFNWNVNKISDTKGNYMSYSYEEDAANGVHRLERISYTGNGSVPTYASLRFEYENRSDTFFGYSGGSPISNLKRLKTIKSCYGETVGRTYTLNYTERTTANPRSLLTSLTETGSDGQSYPALTFNYETPVGGWDVPGSVPPYSLAQKDVGLGAGIMDLNGDSFPDFVRKRISGTSTILANDASLNLPSGWIGTPSSSPSLPDYRLPGILGLAWDGRNDAGARFIDYNGDGLVDIIAAFRNSNGVVDSYAYRNTGTGWVGDTAGAIPTNSTYGNTAYICGYNKSDSGRRLVDVNGDGLPDLVWNSDNPTEAGCLINNVNGQVQVGGPSWIRDDRWAPPFVIMGNVSCGSQLFDVNGDGLPDLIQHGLDNSGIRAGVALNSPTGWAAQNQVFVSITTPYATYQAQLGAVGQYLPPAMLSQDGPNYTSTPIGSEVVDLNGDGLPDILVSNPQLSNSLGLARAYLNTGGGWVASPAYYPPSGVNFMGRNPGSNTDPTGAVLADINGDGLPDISVYRADQSPYYYLNTGRGWGTVNTSYLGSANLSLPAAIVNSDFTYPTGTQLADINGDGVTDILTSTDSNKQSWLNKAKPTADKLTKVTNGLGVAASVSYALLNERDASGNPTVYTKGTGATYPLADVTGPMLVVKTVNNDDGTFTGSVPNQYPVSYKYAGLRTHALRGSLGFAYMEVTDGRTNIQSQTTYAQTYPFIGMPILTKTVSGSVTLSETLVTYGQVALNGGLTKFVFASDSLTTMRELNGTITGTVDTSVLASDIDTFGNIKKIVVDTDGFVKTTNSIYTNDTTNWFLGRLTSATVASTAPSLPTITRTSSFTYNTAGLLETETVETGNNTLSLTTTYAYDQFGNKNSATVSGATITVDSTGTMTAGATVSRATSTNYDSNGRFPINTTNALGHSESYNSYDQVRGVLTQMTGANGLVTTWSYDGFGRKTQENRADGTSSFTAYRWVSGAPAQAQYYGTAPAAKYHVETAATGVAPTLAFYDAFGRAFLSLGINGDGKIVYQTKQYDAQGRAYGSSTPYFASGTAYWARTTSYDVLNRPLGGVTPDEEAGGGQVSTSYAYSVVGGYSYGSVTDPKGRVSSTTKNSQGWTMANTRNETSLAGAPASTVTYGYDAIGNLTSTNADAVVTTLAYDLRGRKTSMIDADMGTWNYRYNIFGELIWQKDAKGQITTMAYDALGRLTSRVETEGTTTWTYDTATKAGGQFWKGKLASVSAPGGYLETYDYDAYGRPGTVWRTIPGATNTAFEPRFFVTQTYDSSGRPLKTIYPTGFQTTNVYNGYGYLKEVRRADSNRSDVYWMADTYSVTGKVDGEYYGNGLINDRVYSDATGRLRTAAIGRGIETAAPFSIQYLQYNYDAMGNVTTRGDGPTARAESFTYDGLDRLKTHVLTGFATVSVNYDQKGNITYKSDVGNYTYVGYGPHAMNSVSGGTLGTQNYVYDANGNMQTGGGRSITWTSFNQVKRVQNTANTIFSDFSFGAGHERVKQVSHTGTTVYVGSLFEQVTGLGGNPLIEYKHYIYSPTGRIAVRTERNDTTVDTRYFHTDGLGSITAVTNERGQIVKRFAFDAWGKRVDPSTNGVITSATNGKFTRGYTDHEQLDDLGLIHMNGRIYDPVLGRFLSADPNIDGVSDAQGYNRYTYVGNNPMNATDPSGYFKFWKDFLGPIVQAVAIVVGTIFAGPLGGMLAGALVGATINGWKGAIQGAAMGMGFYAGGMVGMSFASSFSGSLLNGGSLGDAFKAGVISGAITWATAGVAQEMGISGGWENYLFQGTVNGGIEAASGGDFGHGFAMGVASAFTSRQIWTGIAALERYYAAKNAPTLSPFTGSGSASPGGNPTSGPTYNQSVLNQPWNMKDIYGILAETDDGWAFASQLKQFRITAYDSIKVVGTDPSGNAVNATVKWPGFSFGGDKMYIQKGLTNLQAIETMYHETRHQIYGILATTAGEMRIRFNQQDFMHRIGLPSIMDSMRITNSIPAATYNYGWKPDIPRGANLSSAATGVSARQ